MATKEEIRAKAKATRARNRKIKAERHAILKERDAVNEKIGRVQNLADNPGTEGERSAALAASQRLEEKRDGLEAHVMPPPLPPSPEAWNAKKLAAAEERKVKREIKRR